MGRLEGKENVTLTMMLLLAREIVIVNLEYKSGQKMYKSEALEYKNVTVTMTLLLAEKL